MTDQAIRERVEELHEHLRATAELPVDPGVSPSLGEAEAVAADVADDPAAPEAAIRMRAAQVEELLSHVDSTGDPAADEHVEAARALASSILDAIEE